MSKADAVFDAYARYYDLLYQDKDYVAEVAYIDRLLKQHGVAGRELLEFGSGTGKHGCLLAERGYRVTGIERSSQMVATAGKREGFRCQHGDIRTVKLVSTFDAVVSLFHVVSYQVSNESACAVFDRAAEHLGCGGLFLFDIWYSPAIWAQRPAVRVKRMSDERCEIIRIAEPVIHANENRVDVGYTVFARDRASGYVETLLETHSMRHFSLPELDQLAARSGFQRLAAEEFLTGRAPGEDTWGVCVVLRRQ